MSTARLDEDGRLTAFNVHIVTRLQVKMTEEGLWDGKLTISGDFSSEVDVRAARNITILGNTSDVSMNPINIHALVSSGGTKIKTNFSIYPDVDGNFVEKLENIAVNYIQLEYNATATVTASALFN